MLHRGGGQSPPINHFAPLNTPSEGSKNIAKKKDADAQRICEEG